jgi:hypothetical protein
MAMQLAIFSAAGGLLAIIGVAGTTILDRSFRFPLDVHHRLKLPVIAVIPNAAPVKKVEVFRKRSRNTGRGG